MVTAVRTTSDVINEIIAWLERNGVSVERFAFELPSAGMYRSETKEIFLNVANALEALVTIAHEAGHWLGYLIEEKPHSYQRERQAFVYGWWVLQQFEAYEVSRNMWIEKNRANLQRAKRQEDTGTRHLFWKTPPPPDALAAIKRMKEVAP